jgi:hypothetical protein
VQSSVRSVYMHEVASESDQVVSALYAQADATDTADATLQTYSDNGSEYVEVTNKGVLSAGQYRSTPHGTYQKRG